MKSSLILALLLFAASAGFGAPRHKVVATFSIVAADTAAHEMGVAVASRFFAVGSVVPWARADVGAVATQANANTTYGWRGLDLLAQGSSPQSALDALLKADPQPDARQVGIVAADGRSVTYTGPKCTPWAGGRSGPNYAVQGNILAGEEVVNAMEKAFLTTKGTLADRMYAALVAGDRKGGDSRGKQSAALVVVKAKAGFNGFTDRAIDIRVDDNPDPFKELGRLLNIAQMNYYWNEAWTLFTQKKPEAALPLMAEALSRAPENPEVLYDLAVISLAAGKENNALDALEKALRLNPKLKKQAAGDADLAALRNNPRFKELVE